MNTRNTWLIATTLWLINPVCSGCDSSTEPEFDFGEAEMIELLSELNTQTWEVTFNGELSTVSLDLAQSVEEQASLWSSASSAVEFGSAHACGSRSFIGSADACIDMSSLPIEGTLTISSNLEVESEPQTFVVEGALDVFGTTLDNAEVWLSNDDIRADFSAYAEVDGDTLTFDLNSIE